jgi:hypothetical protein
MLAGERGTPPRAEQAEANSRREDFSAAESMKTAAVELVREIAWGGPVCPGTATVTPPETPAWDGSVSLRIVRGELSIVRRFVARSRSIHCIGSLADARDIANANSMALRNLGQRECGGSTLSASSSGGGGRGRFAPVATG